MPKFKLNPRQLRNLMVAVLLSFVVALPLLGQPLGLTVTNQPAADVDVNTSMEDNEDIVYTLEPVEAADNSGQVFNRGRNLTDSTAAAEPAPTDEAVTEPSDIEPSEATETEPESEPEETEEPEEPAEPEEPEEPEEPAEPLFTPVDYLLYIATGTLNMRAEPSTEAAILARLEFGSKVNCTGENGEWLQVAFEGKTGYVKSEYTSKTMVFKSVSQTVYVDASKLNLRESPSTDSAVVMSLEDKQKLTRTGIGDGWSKVKSSSGKVGYVASQFLTTKAPASSSGSGTVSASNAPASSRGQRIVDLAYSALGVRYVYASASMSGGFDCSGLVKWAYSKIGVSVPRTSINYRNAGVTVSYKYIRPGDVLCMDTNRSDGRTAINHVGIYIGGGKMIHASSSKGKVVVQNLADYFKYVKLITVRRFLSN